MWKIMNARDTTDFIVSYNKKGHPEFTNPINENRSFVGLTNGSAYSLLETNKKVITNIIFINMTEDSIEFKEYLRMLARLPYDTYVWSAEPRLGNKYEWISKMFGGAVIKEGIYRYKVNKSDFAMKTLKGTN